MKKTQLTLAAILATMVFTACIDKIGDDPVPFDNKAFMVDDTHMDKSIRPGDDFFMYCNGGYWNNTVVDENNMCKTLLVDQAQDWITNTVSSLTIPNKNKILADIEKTDEATLTAQQAKLQDALDRINAIITREEAWQLAAQLFKEGYHAPIDANIFSNKGKIGIVLGIDELKAYDPPHTAIKQTLAWRLGNEPELLARMRPITSAGTRGFDNTQWPMLVTMCNTLGIPLENAYTVESLSTAVEKGLVGPAIEELKAYQEKSVEEWQAVLKDALMEDVVFFDNKEKAAVSLNNKDLVNRIAARYMKYEISRAFTDATITDEMKQRTLDYCRRLQAVFRERIRQNEWMSNGSKQNAIEKLDAMVFNCGAPDEWYEEGLADLSQEPSILDDVMALRRAYLTLLIKLTGMDTPKACFHAMVLKFTLTTMNAFYDPNTNSTNIYPAFMVKPYYDQEQSDAHNYANMMFYAHEITHGFDPGGAKYNKDGDLGDIWATEADRLEFQKRSQQLIDYFSSLDLLPAEVDLKNNGAYTNEENVADLGGFLLAYESYVGMLQEQGFTGEQYRLQQQRFYEAYAYTWCGKWTASWAKQVTVGSPDDDDAIDNHSLGRERVNGVITNTDDWYDLFDVTKDNKLYVPKEKRVRIW